MQIIVSRTVNNIMKKLIFLLLLFIWGALIFGTIATNAQTDPSYGLNDTAGKVSAFQGSLGKDYTNFLSTKTGQIIGVILSFVGVLFLGLMIYAGLMWMTSNGNEQLVTKAKDLIINSVIGIIIVFAAYALTSFLGQEVIK